MAKYLGQERRSILSYFPRQLRFLFLTVILTIVVLLLFARLPDIYKSGSQPLILISHVRSEPLKNSGPHKTAIFLSIDSSLLKDSSDISTTVQKWSAKESVVQSCNAANYCSVQIFLYDDDKKTTSASVRDSLQKLFLRESLNSTAKPENIIHTVPKRNEDARRISEVVQESYISGVSYFLFLTSVHLESDRTIGRGVTGLVYEMSTWNPRDVGVIQLGNSSAPDLNLTISGFLVSKLHIEIFGSLFPFEIATLSSALTFLSTIYPRTMYRTLDQGAIKVITSEPIVRNSTELTTGFMQEQRDVIRGYLKAVLESGDCLRCNLKSSKRIIAMSLYGSGPRYTWGALRNAQLLPVHYPGWRLWFYTEQEPKDGKRRSPAVPIDITNRIEELGAEFRYIDVQSTGLAPMLWRFSVAEEKDVEVFIIRDSDSRLTMRDAAVVREWLKTDKPFHCIRDHPSHSNYAVSGGLWGGRPERLRVIFNGSLQSVMKKYGAGYVEDMQFLERDVWPKVKDSYAYCHDSFSCQRYPSSFPFPVVRKGYEHLGQVYNQHSIGRHGDINILKNHGVNAKCVPS